MDAKTATMEMQSDTDTRSLMRPERRLRRLAAILVAPGVVIGLLVLGEGGYLAAPGHREKFIGDLNVVTLASYLGSAFSAIIMGLVLRKANWRPTASLIMWLFPTVCGTLALALFGVLILLYFFFKLTTNAVGAFGWGVGPVFVIGAMIFAAPVALVYCLVSGVPWRRPAGA